MESHGGAGYNVRGFISNVRYSNIARTVSVPTGAYSSDANTILLACVSNRFLDISSTAASFTITGTPSVQAFSPFQTNVAYTPALQGGSGYFDGTGDYLTWSGSTVGTGAFTFECWFYYTGTFSGIAAFVGPGTAVTNALNLYINNSTQLTFDQYGVTATSFTVPTMTANQWYHVVFVRNAGGSATVFLNGVRSSTGAVSITTNYASIGAIGYVSSAVPRPWIGYLSGVKYSQSAVYDPTQTTITIPTAPPSSSGANLLLNFTNAGIVDTTGKIVLETLSGARISTAQSKYGGSSMLFNGSTDALNFPVPQSFYFRTGDFTIEFWANYTSTGTGVVFIGNLNNNTNANGVWSVYHYGNTNNLAFFCNAGVNYQASWTPVTNTWYHIAVCRSGTSLRMFVNGTQIGSTSTSTDNIGSLYQQSGGWYVARSNDSAAYFPGYLSDIRVTTGFARYTANFTPPTSLLQNQ